VITLIGNSRKTAQNKTVQNKTVPTDGDVAAFVAAIADPTRRA